MISINLPSKTYLLGEYIVLEGAPCLILNTPPYFKADCHVLRNDGETIKNNFHPKSPAGLLMEKNADFFKKHTIEFFDPHEGKGGFGASGAQFIAVYAALHGISKNIEGLEKLLKNYWDVLKAHNSVLTSGADLIAQASGSFEKKPLENLSNIIYWHRAEKQWNNFVWPFTDISYCLIRTGYKCVTHDHIKKLSSSSVKEMSNIVEEGYTAFQLKNSSNFLEAIKSYADQLKKENCLLKETDELIQLFCQSNLIEAAKGCGTLGADVVLVLLRREKMSVFLDWLRERGMVVVHAVSPGQA